VCDDGGCGTVPCSRQAGDYDVVPVDGAEGVDVVIGSRLRDAVVYFVEHFFGGMLFDFERANPADSVIGVDGRRHPGVRRARRVNRGQVSR